MTHHGLVESYKAKVNIIYMEKTLAVPLTQNLNTTSSRQVSFVLWRYLQIGSQGMKMGWILTKFSMGQNKGSTAYF